ncbi:MAG: cytochrome c3 family protein [Candidatus Rokubacteria bacterium]|nr:cytochrome c3 family protein [Candidatus Rokubacteria bacterium]
MKVLRFALFLAVVALLLPTASWAATGGTGIAGTDHDFSGKGTPPTGLCTFCHTPHKALSTLLLWNHTLSTNTFSWDVPATTAGTLFPTFKGDTYNGPTAKCLSCHDGSVAVGDIAWFNGGKPVGLDNTKHGLGDKYNVGFGGAMKGNHPVAMPYPYQNAKNTYNGVTTGNAAELSEYQLTPLSPIRIFNDDGSGNITAGAVAAKTGLECSSCHDPHNKASVDDLFLRGTLGGNTTAYICMKCHIK